MDRERIGFVTSDLLSYFAPYTLGGFVAIADLYRRFGPRPFRRKKVMKKGESFLIRVGGT